MDKHAKTETLSGLAYLIIYFGALLHVIQQGDWLSAIVMSIGTLLAIFYGIEHLRSKRGGDEFWNLNKQKSSEKK